MILSKLKQEKEFPFKNDRESLKREYLEKIVSKTHLTNREKYDLVYHYVNDYFHTLRTRMDIHNVFFKDKNTNIANHILERARVYYRKQFNFKPKIHIHNVNKESLKPDTLIYDEEFNLYVWNGKEFDEVEYFKK